MGTPLPQTPSPHPQPPQRSSPGGGHSDHRDPLRQAGLGRCPWAGNWARKQGDPPETAQPSWGLDAYKRRLVLSRDACAFSNIPTAALRGQLHPHSRTKPARVGYGGCCQAVGSTLFQNTPCHILNTIHLTLSHLANPTALGTQTQSHCKTTLSFILSVVYQFLL